MVHLTPMRQEQHDDHAKAETADALTPYAKTPP